MEYYKVKEGVRAYYIRVDRTTDFVWEPRWSGVVIDYNEISGKMVACYYDTFKIRAYTHIEYEFDYNGWASLCDYCDEQPRFINEQHFEKAVDAVIAGKENVF